MGIIYRKKKKECSVIPILTATSGARPWDQPLYSLYLTKIGEQLISSKQRGQKTEFTQRK